MPNQLTRVLAIALLSWPAIVIPQPANGADQADSLELLTRTLRQTDNDAVRAALLRGMVEGLAGRRNLPAPGGWDALKKDLQVSPDASVRELADRLAQIFGDPEAIERAMRTLRSKDQSTSARRAALKALLQQQHDGVLSELEALMDEPELQIDAIRAFGVFDAANAPKLLLARYDSLDPQAKRAVIETLATRKNYARKLVEAIKSKAIQREEIPVYVARSLREIAGDEFTKVYGAVPEIKHNTRQQIAKYKRMITPKAIADADVRMGRVIYQKTCAACHLLYGEGGKIGPDLTGSNRANLDYILLNSLAPSEDVPEGYRMVIVETVDGRIVNGVIAEEDGQRIVLKTVDDPELVIAKEDIEARKVSEKSMMPDGQLQQLTKQQVIDLIKYLQTTEQVELPQS